MKDRAHKQKLDIDFKLNFIFYGRTYTVANNGAI